jgi:hypothetical protein
MIRNSGQKQRLNSYTQKACRGLSGMDKLAWEKDRLHEGPQGSLLFRNPMVLYRILHQQDRFGVMFHHHRIHQRREERQIQGIAVQMIMMRDLTPGEIPGVSGNGQRKRLRQESSSRW